jgi:hypothetical protein
MIKRLPVVVLAAIALLAGVWLGEDPGWPPGSGLLLLASSVVWLLLGWLLTRLASRVWYVGLVVGVACAGMFGAGLLLGDQESTRALNDCIDRGETVRAALSDYHRQHGRYPDELAELGMSDLPGNLLLRGNILRYRSTGTGYRLEFGDWLVTHEATESSPFAAHK